MMRKFLILLYISLSLSTVNAQDRDLLDGAAAKTLFQVLFLGGGDAFCTANSCELIAHCEYSKPSHFECSLNGEEVSATVSEGLFRGIFNSSITMDGKCSANFCELTAKCSYLRIDESEYHCEIY